MEATGAARLVKRLSTDGTVYIGEYVSDDDSSSREILNHSYEESIKAGLMSAEDRPRYKHGEKSPDNG